MKNDNVDRTQRTKRVLFVIMEFPPYGGGAGRCLQETLRHLKTMEGFAYHLLVGTGKDGPTPEMPDVTIQAIPLRRRSALQCGVPAMMQFLVQGTFAVRRYLRTHAIDLVHYYFSIPCGLIALLQPRHIPYAVTLCGGDVPGYNEGELQGFHAVLKPANRAVLRGARHVFSLSNSLALQARQTLHYHRDIQTIYSGSNFPCVDKPRQSTHHPFRIIAVGRLVAWKGMMLLVRAMPQLPDAHLTIVGDGPQREELRKAVLDMQLEEKVRFTGGLNHEEVREELRHADLFCLPSKGDSFGLVFVEAMSQALPVVAADAGGVPEVVNSDCGTLVKPGSLEELVAAVQAFCDDPDYYRATSQAALERVRHTFSWKRAAEEYHRRYLELLP